ncbi:glycoside hydrolase family 71/99 protein [Rhodovastum atsumiense]|uniref:Uncharacterized protein n=1 Tax=Rhodovastum atsumiense TaxID=504468 RepID=A0A5M6IJZ3_9PROT|nr:hypothetical protein [Rhodovastum atsumiense]KAA5608586.1 hypothetical protein F1189_28305 [Rhodovastum atsumiense]
MFIKFAAKARATSVSFRLGLLISQFCFVTSAFAGDRPTIGAIRWDAWYVTSSPAPGYFTCSALAARQYHWRAPWFFQKTADGGLDCNQKSIAEMGKIIDQEIVYAHTAGLGYWAFVWYRLGDPMLEGWRLYQQSLRRNEVKWSMIVGYSQFHFDMTRANGYASPEVYAQFFMQDNFQRVLDHRPLLYLFRDSGVTNDQLKADVLALRRATLGVGNPYVVVMFANAALAARDAAEFGGDAISAYATVGNGEQHTFKDLAREVSTLRSAMAATGYPVIPLAMTGWDTRPEHDRVLPWKPQAHLRPSRVYDAPNPDELKTEMNDIIAWIRTHRAAAPANVALIYAWNEFTEGGWLCPTWTDNGPDVSRINSLAEILK